MLKAALPHSLHLHPPSPHSQPATPLHLAALQAVGGGWLPAAPVGRRRLLLNRSHCGRHVPGGGVLRMSVFRVCDCEVKGMARGGEGEEGGEVGCGAVWLTRACPGCCSPFAKHGEAHPGRALGRAGRVSLTTCNSQCLLQWHPPQTGTHPALGMATWPLLRRWWPAQWQPGTWLSQRRRRASGSTRRARLWLRLHRWVLFSCQMDVGEEDLLDNCVHVSIHRRAFASSRETVQKSFLKTRNLNPAFVSDGREALSIPSLPTALCKLHLPGGKKVPRSTGADLARAPSHQGPTAAPHRRSLRAAFSPPCIWAPSTAARRPRTGGARGWVSGWEEPA